MHSSARPLRIAGSGPSGLAAAITLARAARPVEVFERLDEPGARFGGSHQVLAAYGERPRAPELLEELGVGVGELEGRWLDEARFLVGEDRVRRLRSRRPFAFLLRRGAGPRQLDGRLADHAAALGVSFCCGRRLDPADCDVEATGPRRVDGLALERVFTTGAENRADVFLDPSRFGGGYAYLFVHEGRGTLGVALLRDYADLEEHWERARHRFAAVEGFEVRETQSARHRMNFAVPESAEIDGRLRVGEAGGFQDFLFGLGLRQSLLTGSLAARSLLGGEPFDAAWQSRLVGRMQASRVDRWAYEKGLLPALLNRAPVGDLGQALDRMHRGHAWRWPLLPWIDRAPRAREAQS